MNIYPHIQKHMDLILDDLLYCILCKINNDPVERYATVCRRWYAAIMPAEIRHEVIKHKYEIVLYRYVYKYTDINRINIWLYSIFEVNKRSFISLRPQKQAPICAAKFTLYQSIYMILYVKYESIRYALVGGLYHTTAYDSSEYIDIFEYIRYLMSHMNNKCNSVIKYNKSISTYIENLMRDDINFIANGGLCSDEFIKYISEQ